MIFLPLNKLVCRHIFNFMHQFMSSAGKRHLQYKRFTKLPKEKKGRNVLWTLGVLTVCRFSISRIFLYTFILFLLRLHLAVTQFCRTAAHITTRPTEILLWHIPLHVHMETHPPTCKHAPMTVPGRLTQFKSEVRSKTLKLQDISQSRKIRTERVPATTHLYHINISIELYFEVTHTWQK